MILGVAIVTLLIYVMMRWRTRSSRSGRWVAAGVLGLLTAGASAAYALVMGLLLTSATWGNHASDFFERNRLVEAASPAWLWWLLVLLLAFVGITAVLMLGPATRADGRKRNRWYAYAGLAAVPVSTLGVLATTATLAL